jgi:hypothetical protein
MGAIEKYSSKTLLLNEGNCLFLGQPNEAVQRFYLLSQSDDKSSSLTVLTDTSTKREKDELAEKVDEILDWPDPTAFLSLDGPSVLGDGGARCTSIALCSSGGQPCRVFEIGDEAVFYYEFEVLRDIDVPIGGVVITNVMNINVYGKNTAQYLLEAPPKVPRGAYVRFRQSIQLSLAPGQYTFSVGFSTIPASDYANFRFMPYALYNQKAQVLLVVQKAGSFQVILRTTQQDLPFHGTADLPGNFKVTVIKPSDTTGFSKVYSERPV